MFEVNYFFNFISTRAVSYAPPFLSSKLIFQGFNKLRAKWGF